MTRAGTIRRASDAPAFVHQIGNLAASCRAGVARGLRSRGPEGTRRSPTGPHWRVSTDVAHAPVCRPVQSSEVVQEFARRPGGWPLTPGTRRERDPEAQAVPRSPPLTRLPGSSAVGQPFAG